MESWNPNHPNGSTSDDHNDWAGYGFPDQSGPLDDGSQPWAQSISDQAMYSSMDQPTPNGTGFYPATTHAGGHLISDGLGGTPSLPAGDFGAGHVGLPQYQNSQEFLDPSFDSLQQDLFNAQNKLDMVPGLGDFSPVQPHQRQPGAQAFQQQGFPFPSGNEHAFQQPLSFSPSQPMGRPQGHQSNAQQAYEIGHPQPQQPQPQQPQPAPQAQPQHSQQQPQQSYQQHQVYTQPAQQPTRQPMGGGQIYGGPQAATYPQAMPPQQKLGPASQNTLTQPQPQYTQAYLQHHPSSFTQTTSSPSPASTPQHGNLTQAGRNISSQISSPSSTLQSPASSANVQGTKRTVEQAAAPSPSQASVDSNISSEPAVKKRKRSIKKVSDTDAVPASLHTDVSIKTTDQPRPLPPPRMTKEDMDAINDFLKVSSSGKTKFPGVQGAFYLISPRTIKLPTPKSYDKLAPLVALPSQSRNPILPGRTLPCEIQGQFTDRFKPSGNGAGLEDRRRDAKDLLAQFEKSMAGLGSRRPKYTEYPHAFKEQLKADEASKAKAERLARKLAEEERNKPVRPETRPDDPIEGAAWDIIGIVHIDASATRTTALLAGAVQQAGEYIIARRAEMMRARQDVDQATREKKLEEVPKLQANADLKQQILCRTLDAANEVGDEVVLENLGGHSKLVLNLMNLLIACIKAGDFSGQMLKSALRLLANFRITQKIASQTNLETIRRRLSDKGDAEVKEYLAAIMSKIKKGKEPDSEASPKKSTTTSSTKAKLASSKMATDSAPGKRARPDEPDSRSAKKQAIDLGATASSSQASSKSGTVAGATQSKPALTKPRPSAGILPGKSRAVSKPAPKIEPTKSEPVKSDTGKPSTTEDKQNVKVEQKKATVKPESKPEIPKPPKPSSVSASLGGIASLLDSINAPKPQAKPPPKDPKEDREKKETPEERAKRLKKEARRRLRVSWKADEELEQVRYFHKEDEEDTGFDSRMTRDAADDKGEGMVLKRRGKVLDEDEEDEEDELPYRPWLDPTPMDFSNIPEDYRKKTYTTRGGDLIVNTKEQKFMAEREQKVLIAIYQDISDIPPTPKSPLANRAEPMVETKIGHLPRDEPRFEEIHRRWKEVQQLGRDSALQYAMKRIDSRKAPANQVNSILDTLRSAAASGQVPPARVPELHQGAVPAAVQSLPRDEQIIALLTSDRAKQWKDPEPTPTTHRRHDYPDPRVQQAADIVEEVTAKLAGHPYPPVEPPEWLKDNKEAVKEWWLGYNKDAAAKAKKEAEEKARAEAERFTAMQNQAGADAWAAYYAQQQAYAPYMAILQQMQAGNVPQATAPTSAPAPVPAQAQSGQTGTNDQLQAVLAALGQSQTQPSTVAPAVASGAAPQIHPNDTTYQQLMMLTQIASQQQQSTQQQPQQGQHGQQPPPHHHRSGGDQGLTLNYDDAPPREWDRERERDRDRDRDWDRDRDRDRDRERDRDGRHGGNGRGKHKTSGNLPPHRPVNRALIGTKPCIFYKQGTCARGDQCTFRHE